MTLHQTPGFRCAGVRTRVATLAALVVAIGSVATTAGHAQSVTLRPLADEAGLTLGAAVDAQALGDEAYRGLLIDHVNLVSTHGDLSMAALQPEPGVFDFSSADAVVDFAVANDMAVRGHELIGGAVPGWVSSGSWTADSLSQVLRDHVTAVVGHFRKRNPGVVTQWDVVGDAVLADGTRRPTIWQQVIGDDYLRIAFEAAREADPDAVLFYDDFYDDLAVTQDAVATGMAIVPGATAELTTCDAVPKCVGIRDLVGALVADGVPIDGVGFQSQLFSPDPADLSQLTGWVADLGLAWAVTEFAVPLPVTEVTNAEGLQFQAGVYAAALAACADAPNCDTFVTWGITDRLSSLPAETGGAFGGALWFDANDAAKPAFDAIVDVLRQRGTTPATTPTSAPAADPTAAPVASEPDHSVAPTVTSDIADIAETPDGASPVVAVLVGLVALAAIAGVIVIARQRRRTPRPSE